MKILSNMALGYAAITVAAAACFGIWFAVDAALNWVGFEVQAPAEPAQKDVLEFADWFADLEDWRDDVDLFLDEMDERYPHPDPTSLGKRTH